MSWHQALDKLSEKLNSKLLVQEEHGFQKGAQCGPLATGAPKKPGLDMVNTSTKPTRSPRAPWHLIRICRVPVHHPLLKKHHYAGE